MITCVIKIKEVPGKGYYVDVIPDQSKGTPKEMRVAGCLNFALDEVARYLMSKGDRGEMIEGKDLAVVQEITRRKIAEFERQNEEL
jgi:hypothetical protein